MEECSATRTTSPRARTRWSCWDTDTGGAVGLVLSAALAQFLSRLLYGVDALDPVTYLAVPLVLGTVAMVASWVPARRVGQVDPVTALRSE